MNHFIYSQKFILVILIVYYCSISISFSQSFKLVGKVLDENNKAIEFANAILLKTDSIYINGAITDSLGFFTISTLSGNYMLQIKMIGRECINKSIILLKDENIGDIILGINNINISGVTITSVKPLVKREIDRLVFDAGSVAIAGNNVVDVLRNVPGLIVTNDQILIIGKGEVKVLINDRELKMSGSDMMNILKTYRANDLSKIEVITTPPAKYDAEGDAGILNIILKKAKNDYLGGNISYAHSFSTYNYGEFGGSVSYNKNNITSFLNLSGGLGTSIYQESNIKYYPLRRWNSSTDIENIIKYGSMRFGLDYLFKGGLNIGVHTSVMQSVPDQKLDNVTFIFSENKYLADSSLRSTNQIGKLIKRSTLNLHLDKKIGKGGKMIRFDIDYLYSKSVKNEEFNSNTYSKAGIIFVNNEFKFQDENSINLQALSSSLDFLFPFEKFTLSMGAKTTISDTKSKIYYYNQTFLNDQNDIFIYEENISSLYTDFNTKLNKALSLKLGLRMEYTQTKGYSKLTESSQEDSYVKFFPTFYFGYSLNENQKFNFSLSSRISRPGFNRVNPFKLYENQFSFITGKANLKPATIYTLNLGHTFKNNFNTDMYYTYKNDLFTQLIEMDSLTNISNTRWDNFLTSHAVGITNSYSFNKLIWLQTYLQQGVYYLKSISNSVYTIKQQSGFVYTASIRNNFYLNKSKTFVGQLSATYTSRQYTAPTTTNAYYDLDAGLAYSLYKGNLNIGLNVYNLLSTKYSGFVNSNGMEMEYDNHYSYRILNLSLNFNFGAPISIKQRKYSSSDIQNRL